MEDTTAPKEKKHEFNGVLAKSVDETIAQLLGESVVVALHAHLLQFHDVTVDEIPYRLDTLLSILESTFGSSAKTISKAIAKQFYEELGLEFKAKPGMTLIDYVEDAKAKLGGE